MEAKVILIQEKLAAVQQRIEHAALKSGRKAGDVQLVVVTKTQPVEVVEAVLLAGSNVLGENYPEETLPKILALREKYHPQWQMIGHLQSRKTGIVAEHFQMLQSLDRMDLAARLERTLQGLEKQLPVLLEVNVSGEESKFGWPAWQEREWSGLAQTVKALQEFQHLKVCGLMTMPPLSDDPEQVRPFFARTRRLLAYLNHQLPELQMTQLSMGTSSDFEIAVEEGATLVRIGTAIVGPRAPKK